MNEHIPVLLEESINLLNIKNDGIYVDCTLGRAGHSSKILKKLTNKGMLYCFEQDIEAIKKSKVILNKISNNYKIIHSNFKNLEAELTLLNVKKVDGILYDLGVSSPQFDTQSRGFSYKYDSKLDMRMNQEQQKSAYNVVNEFSLKELEKIFREYGEEKFSYNIAKNIINYKTSNGNIETTFELVNIIKRSLPQKKLRKSKHPAKKVFQAIRIEVNDELNVLKSSLKQALKILNKNGILIVISFHSLEDRIVKNIFKEVIKNPYEEINKKIPIIKNWESNFKIINKKIIIPKPIEIEKNRRSKSAKLRAIQKINF